MDSIKILFSAIAIAVVPDLALSDEVKPFGLVFGENPDSAHSCRQIESLALACSVNPPIQSSIYENYRIFLTPTTNQTFEIVAWTRYDTRLAAQEAFLAVNGALENRYGAGNKEIGVITDSHTFNSGPILIVSEWAGDIGSQIVRIKYTHRELERILAAEVVEIRAQNASAAGDGL